MEDNTSNSKKDVKGVSERQHNKDEDNDFEIILASKASLGDNNDEDGTIIATTINDISERRLLAALSSYDPKNSKYSVYLNEGLSPSKVMSFDEIDMLSTNTQDNLSKVLRINAYNRKLINRNDIVGKTVESIDTNINTTIKLVYRIVPEGKKEENLLKKAKILIDNFNESIKIKRIIRDSILTSYIEGNWIAYLRHEDNDNYIVDTYPLGVCEMSDYEINGDPIILFNMNELRTRLQKNYKRTKKNKALFFKDMNEEVKANYPREVYKAFKDKETYAKLDPAYTGDIRINNLGRKYGVSPLLRAYMDLSMLDTFADTDRINSKAKSKKIIHQKMRKEVLGDQFSKDTFPLMAYAHDNFMSAWAQPTVVVTTPPTVEEISYVEPTVEMTSKDTYDIYRSKVLSTLGIQFLTDIGSQSVSTASISVTQLMRTINAISSQLEDVLRKWYKQVLVDNGIPEKYAPFVSVIDSEQMEAEIKQSFASLLFSTMNCSYTTAFEILGLDVNDEYNRRKAENDMGFDEVFKAHGSQYTSSNTETEPNSDGGRPPSSENEDKQGYDKIRQDNL